MEKSFVDNCSKLMKIENKLCISTYVITYIPFNKKTTNIMKERISNHRKSNLNQYMNTFKLLCIVLPSGGVTKNFENMMMYVHEKEKTS